MGKRANRAPKVTKAFAKKVNAVVSRSEETKYVAEGVDIVDVSGYLAVPSGLKGCIPPLEQGTKSNERIGQKISYVKGRVDFAFWLNPGTGSENTASQDVKIKLFFLKSKSIRAQDQIPNLQAGTLLDYGDQTSTDWRPSSYPAFELNQMPLSKEDFSGKTVTLHLRRNFGQANGGTESGVLTYGAIGATHSHSWKHSGSLLYDDGNESTIPTNFAPLYAFVAYNADNSKYTGQVQCIVRKHMWYKDA